ncbi:MAG: hypothetical protein IJR63_03715 [Synergistaceae bacterium]|nr:hypothetical protein [Synergistaceae bacterium]
MLFSLSSCIGQTDFHRALIETVKAALRRKIIGTITEVYLSYVCVTPGKLTLSSGTCC